MLKIQEDCFWKMIDIFDELNILPNIMIIGSWAEYLFPSLFNTDFFPNIHTRDVDLFYRNINIPNEKIFLIDKLKENGFIYDEVDGISKFYKEDILELEFLTRLLGSGENNILNIKSLGIKSEGLRVINILHNFPCEITTKGTNGKEYLLTIPEPAVYVIQKILTNPIRQPINKRQKDIDSVKELLYHIEKNEYHLKKLKDVYNSLSKKQLKILDSVCNVNNINLYKLINI